MGWAVSDSVQCDDTCIVLRRFYRTIHRIRVHLRTLAALVFAQDLRFARIVQLAIHAQPRQRCQWLAHLAATHLARKQHVHNALLDLHALKHQETPKLLVRLAHILWLAL